MNIQIDSARVASELETLAAFSDATPPAVTRVVFSPVDLQARAWLRRLFEDAGLPVRTDAVGNTFARWDGSDQGETVGSGSHIDAIPNAGRYDGTVGVLGALEAVRALQRARFKPRRSVDLIQFTAEEPTRFGIGCLGSRLISGSLKAGPAASLRDYEGSTLDQIRTSAGFSGGLQDVQLQAGAYSAFVELHIEQGPILEREAIDIGIVTQIAAPAALRIEIRGDGGHAGAVLMRDRRDAFVAAAELALAVEAAALATGDQDSVATTGLCHVFPGAVNSVPSHVKLEVDVRDTNAARRDRILEQIHHACQEIAHRRKVGISTEILNADPPAQCDPAIVDSITQACRQLGYTSKRLVSRAYHDSLFMSRIAPAGMIFIPCRAGVSHRPDEFASIEDISRGVAVLAQTLAQLSS